jgi:nucleoid-associated protein YgaU
VSLSTNSQVDAIIAAMQNTAKSTSTIIKTNVDKTKEVQLAAVSQTNPTELLHIQLQQQIDQIIIKNTKSTKNSVSPKTNIVYKKALEKESDVRKNAVRSITIKKGETLWSIAQRAYGNGGLYKKIIEANPQINIKQLFVGQVIRVPK